MNTKNKFFNFFVNNSVSVITVLIVVGIFLPLPQFVIDLCMVLNLSFSILILLTVLFTKRPSSLQTYPRIILYQTIYGIAINVSSTRLILTGTIKNGRLTGQSTMVNAFAQLVGGNNVIVGLVIFLIFVLLQFLVITKGTSRVSEVTARFTLDSMNSLAFEIDNRVNNRFITPEEGEELKKQLREDINFYGKMDGADKFVAGNAKLGAAITAINLFGGIAIGMFFNKMDLNNCLTVYSSLTIGDGLVSQIPSLITSFSTGLLVTGSKSSANFEEQLKKEFLSDSRTYIITSIFLMITGILLRNGTQFVLIPVGALFCFIGLKMEKNTKTESEADIQKKNQKEKNSPEVKEPPVVLLDPVSMEFGYSLLALLNEENGGELLSRIKNIRSSFKLDMGFEIPKIRMVDNLLLESDEYTIRIMGIEVGRGNLSLNQIMCIDFGTVTEPVNGIKAIDPVFKKPAVWVSPEYESQARENGYMTADCHTVIATHLTEIFRTHASELITRTTVSQIVEAVEKTNRELINELMKNNPKTSFTYGEIEKIFQNLLDEQVSIRNYGKIFGTLTEYGHLPRDLWFLTEKVRQALGLQICLQHADQQTKVLHVVTMSPSYSEQIKACMIYPNDGGKPQTALPPDVHRQWVKNVNDCFSVIATSGYQPVIYVENSIRRLVRSLCELDFPGAVVLSDLELLGAGKSIKVEIEGMIGE